MHIYTHKSIQATKAKYYQNIYSLMMEISGVIFGFVSVVIPYIFSKYCSMNLYNFTMIKSYLFQGWKENRQEIFT